MLIIIGIIRKDNFSCAKIFNSYSTQLNYGGCSLVAERTVVASDFARFPFAPDFERGQEEFTDFVLCGIAGKIRVAGVRFSPFTLDKRR